MIKPTVGRMVWFWDKKPQGFHSQPQAAVVTAVWGDRCVNLAILSPNGVPMSHPPTSVTLLQEGDPEPESGSYCQWMPHQVGQAKSQAEPYTTQDALARGAM